MKYHNNVFKKNKDVVERKIDKDTILVPLFKSRDDINAIYTLNEMAGKIWELIDGKRPVAKIREIILKKYKVTEDKLDKDLMKLINDLKKIKVIR
jgi:hypothetical protein